MAKKKHILILVPSFTAIGGITNYYRVLESLFTIKLIYFIRGARTWPVKKGFLNELLRILRDNFLFVKTLLLRPVSLVVTNTAFSSLSVMRDGIFIFIAKGFRKKVIIFIRGWDRDFESLIENKYLKIFKWFYFRADAFIVLAVYEKNKLIQWGYSKKIFLETTVVDDKLVETLSEREILLKYNNYENLNLLFLSRVEISKGIYETLDAFKLIQDKFKHVTITIAGDGFELPKLIQKVKNESISNVFFTGHISGKEKIHAFKKAHIFIFPSYSEGMPNAVLEAMAFGLPVVTRNVGGLVDFFENGEHGFITNSRSPQVFKTLIENLIDNQELLEKIAITNYKLAQERFIASKVIKRIESVYLEVLND